MNGEEKHFYQFNSFRLDVAERQLLNDGVAVPLTPKAFDVLVALVERNGHLVEKDELLRLVWSESFVEEANVARIVHTLRKVLGEDKNGNKFIETVPKRGYRFVADVRGKENEPADFFDARSETTAAAPQSEDESAIENNFVTEVKVIKNAEAESYHSGNSAGAAIENYDVNNVFLPADAFLAPTIEPEAAIQADAARKISNGANSEIVRRKLSIFGACAVLILIICEFAFYQFTKIRQVNSSFRQITLSRLTNSGKAKLVALSPDGNLIAFVTAEKEGNSLSVRQVGMSNTINVVPPRTGEFICLTFSADGRLIYYSFFPGNKMEAEFYSVPALGGISQRISNFLVSSISPAPDGKRFVNTTSDSGAGKTGLAIGNFAGGETRQLTTRKMPSHFSVSGQVCSWSPNGEIIAAVGNDADDKGSYSTLVGVSVQDGAEKPLSAKRWVSLYSIEWRKDGSGLLVIGSDKPAMPNQIWFVSYPDGEARRLTNDLNNYSLLGVSANEKLIVSVQSTQTNSVWIGEIGRSQNDFREIASETGFLSPLELTSDDRLVFLSNADGGSNLWTMRTDGGERRQITTDATADMRGICAAPDAKRIVFVSSRSGKSNLWRIDVSGENLTQLTTGEREAYPICSPDNQFVIYQKGFGAGIKSTLWKVSTTGGGEPVQLTDYFAFRPALSPDGSRVAFFYMTEDKWRIGVIPSGGGAMQESFDVPENVPDRIVRWSSNNRDLLYAANIGEVGNVWQLAPDGQSKQITDFNANHLETFALSPDGKKLAATRTSNLSDVVLISNQE